MNTFDSMPHGYRWMTGDEIEQYNETPERRRCGWMRDEHIGLVTTCLNPVGDPVVKWDCMIEFGMDHDHDPTVCERIMADMNPDYSYAMDNDYDMQSAHYEQFGRPAFPNEY